MRTVLFLSLMLGAAACGSPTPVSEEVAAQEAPQTTSAPVAPAAPAVNLATGIEIGLVYSANLMGELEPCG